MNEKQLKLRPITQQDLPFLSKLYASTREEELSAVDWSDTQKSEFLQMQFDAQHSHYQKHFPNTNFDIIELEDQPVGRLYVDRREDEIRIVDIALLSEYREQGIGSYYLQKILKESTVTRLPVKIHVEHNNPALALYTRLGFKHVDNTGVYYLMVWTPETTPSKEAK